MSENVCHLRLVNGDEILADIIHTDEDYMVVDKPLYVNEQMNSEGKSVVVLTKYIPFAASEICQFKQSHVLTTTPLHPSMVKYYYNSLYFTSNHENKMLFEIEKANVLMEQVMFDHQSSNTHKGSTSVN